LVSLSHIRYLTIRYIPPSFLVKNKYDAALLMKQTALLMKQISCNKRNNNSWFKASLLALQWMLPLLSYVQKLLHCI